MACIYGILPVIEAIRSKKRRIDRIFVQESLQNPRVAKLAVAARSGGTPVVRVQKRELDKLSRGENHQGVIAVIEDFAYHDAIELIQSATPPALLVLLDGVEDPHNLGAIIRTAEAAGASGLFLPEHRAVRVTGTVAKISAGAVEHLPIALAQNVNRLIRQLKEASIWVIGIEPGAPKSFTHWDWNLPTAIVLGNEAKGSRRLVRENCDGLFHIPLHGRVQSLNVSVAAGVVLFEAIRQRGGC